MLKFKFIECKEVITSIKGNEKAFKLLDSESHEIYHYEMLLTLAIIDFI